MASFQMNFIKKQYRKDLYKISINISIKISIIHSSLLYIWYEAYMDSTLGYIGVMKKEIASSICSEEWVTLSFLAAVASTKLHYSFVVFVFF